MAIGLMLFIVLATSSVAAGDAAAMAEMIDRHIQTRLDALGIRRVDQLDSTLVIWMGEFGRSPQITSGGGRNHWPRAWSCVLIRGGIRGGQVIGRSDRDAAEVLERPISVTDFLATVCKVLGIDYTRQNRAPGLERPIPIVDVSQQVKLVSELL